MGRGGDRGRDVRRTRPRAVERDERKAVRFEERERVGALVVLRPRPVPELDERHERREALRRTSELSFRLGRLREARVVLEQDAAELAGELERLERGAEQAERLVRGLAVVPRHRRRRLDVERELVGRSPGPPLRHGGIGERVVRRVHLDDVEALRVVPQSTLRRRDAARVPGLEEPFVGPRAHADAHRSRHQVVSSG